MGLMDKAKRAVQGRSEKIERGVDQAAKAVDKRTGGKYRDKLTKGAEQVKSRARSMDEQRRDAGPTGSTHQGGAGGVDPGGVAGTGTPSGTGGIAGNEPRGATDTGPGPGHDQPGKPGL